MFNVNVTENPKCSNVSLKTSLERSRVTLTSSERSKRKGLLKRESFFCFRGSKIHFLLRMVVKNGGVNK